jgi:hypothetical protein
MSSFVHGAPDVPSVRVLGYNTELRDEFGFVGDCASKRGFHAILDAHRRRLPPGRDPFGQRPSSEISKASLDEMISGHGEAVVALTAAIVDFAAELTHVVWCLLTTPAWRDVRHIAVGGGMRATQVGAIAIELAGQRLREAGLPLTLRPIHHKPDEAGLIGAMYLLQAAERARFETMLAVDIGSTKVRAGVVAFASARAEAVSVWRHGGERPTRDAIVGRLCGMLREHAEKSRHLAPVIGIGCPGLIGADGHIARGAQNLPQGWEEPDFNLPARIAEALPRIGGAATRVMLHNDGVIQGLSEIAWLPNVETWGILTIGTGLGNASFRRNEPAERLSLTGGFERD